MQSSINGVALGTSLLAWNATGSCRGQSAASREKRKPAFAHEAAIAARPKRQSPDALGVAARSPSSTVT
jgi:hypothetical protein